MRNVKLSRSVANKARLAFAKTSLIGITKTNHEFSLSNGDSLRVKVVRQYIGERNVHHIFPLHFSAASRQQVRLKWCAWKLRNNELASMNSCNLSRLGLFPEHYIDSVLSSYSFNLQEKTQVNRY